MARPKRIGFDSFNMDCKFFSDPRVLELTKKCGDSAIVILMAVQARLYRHNGYYFNVDSLMIRLVQSDLGMQYPADQIKDVLKTAVDVGLFEAHMYLTHKILTSPEIQQNFLSMSKANGRRNPKIKPEYLLISTPEEKLPRTEEEVKTLAETVVKMWNDLHVDHHTDLIIPQETVSDPIFIDCVRSIMDSYHDADKLYIWQDIFQHMLLQDADMPLEAVICGESVFRNFYNMGQPVNHIPGVITPTPGGLHPAIIQAARLEKNGASPEEIQEVTENLFRKYPDKQELTQPEAMSSHIPSGQERDLVAEFKKLCQQVDENNGDRGVGEDLVTELSTPLAETAQYVEESNAICTTDIGCTSPAPEYQVQTVYITNEAPPETPPKKAPVAQKNYANLFSEESFELLKDDDGEWSDFDEETFAASAEEIDRIKKEHTAQSSNKPDAQTTASENTPITNNGVCTPFVEINPNEPPKQHHRPHKTRPGQPFADMNDEIMLDGAPVIGPEEQKRREIISEETALQERVSEKTSSPYVREYDDVLTPLMREIIKVFNKHTVEYNKRRPNKENVLAKDIYAEDAYALAHLRKYIEHDPRAATVEFWDELFYGNYWISLNTAGVFCKPLYIFDVDADNTYFQPIEKEEDRLTEEEIFEEFLLYYNRVYNPDKCAFSSRQHALKYHEYKEKKREAELVKTGSEIESEIPVETPPEPEVVEVIPKQIEQTEKAPETPSTTETSTPSIFDEYWVDRRKTHPEYYIDPDKPVGDRTGSMPWAMVNPPHYKDVIKDPNYCKDLAHGRTIRTED